MAEQDTGGVKYGWATGDSGWGDEMNANLQLMAQAGVQLQITHKALNAPPSPATENMVVTVGSSPSGAFTGWAEHSLAIYSYMPTAYTTLGWRNIVPRVGWLMSDGTDLLHYTSSGWAALTSSSGGSTMSLFRGAWSGSSVSYTAGQIVVFRNEQYMCHSNHTSTTINGPMIGATWRLRWHAISSVDIGEVAAVLAKASINNADRLAVQDVSTLTGETKHITIDDLKSDWNVSQSSSPDFIKNKPTLGPQVPALQTSDGDKFVGVNAGGTALEIKDAPSGGTATNNWKGAWATGTAYKEGNIVRVASSTETTAGLAYLCYNDHTAATINQPGTGTNWRNYWHLVNIPDIGALSTQLTETNVADDDRLAIMDDSETNDPIKFVTAKHLIDSKTGPQLPATAGQGGKFAAVNTGGTAIEYVDAPSGGGGGNFTAAEKTKLAGIGDTATDRQSDWSETDTTDETFIKNKPPFVIPDPVTIPGSVVTSTLRLFSRPGVAGRRASGNVRYLQLIKAGTAASTLPGLIEHMYAGTGITGLIYGGGVYGKPDNNKWYLVTIGGTGFNTATITECTTAGATIAGTAIHASQGGGTAGRRAFSWVGNATEGLIVGGWSNNGSGGHAYYNDVYYYNRSSTNVVTIRAVTKRGTAANFAARHRHNMVGDLSSGLIYGGITTAFGGTYAGDMIAYTFDRATLTITLTTLTLAGVSLTARQEFGFVGNARAAIIFGGRAGSYGYQVTNDFKQIKVSSTTATVSNLSVWGTAPSRRDAMLMIGSSRTSSIFGGRLGTPAYDNFFVDTSGTSAIVIPLFNSQSLYLPSGRSAGYGDSGGYYMYGGNDLRTNRLRKWHDDFWGVYISNIVYPSYGTPASTPVGVRRIHAMAGTAVSGVIYGGYNNTADLSDFWRYTVSGETTTTVQLSHSGSSLGARAAMRMLGSATAGIIHGGSGQRIGDIHSFTVSGNNITTTALTLAGDDLPDRSFFGMVGTTSLFLIYGGYTSFGFGDGRKDVYRVSVASGTATVKKITPTGDDMPIRWGHGMVGDASTALVFGGTNFSDAAGVTSVTYDDFYRITATATTATIKKLTKSGDTIPAGARVQMIGTVTAGIIFGIDANVYQYNVTANDVRITAIRGAAIEMSRVRDATVVGTATAGMIFGGHVNYAVSNRFIKYTVTPARTEAIDTTGTLQAQITAMRALFQRFLTTVVTDPDSGVTGQGTTASPVRLSNPFTDVDEANLNRLANEPTGTGGLKVTAANVSVTATQIVRKSSTTAIPIRDGAVVLGDQTNGVVIGGISASAADSSGVWRYNVDTSNEVTATALTRAGTFPSGIINGVGAGSATQGILFGGLDGNGNYINKWYSYTVNATTNTITFAELTIAGITITGRNFHSLAGDHTAGIIGMGFYFRPQFKWLNDFYSYTVSSGTVTVAALNKRGDFVEDRRGAILVGDSETGLLFGGESQYNADLSGGQGDLVTYTDVRRYDVATGAITFTRLTTQGDLPDSFTGGNAMGDADSGILILSDGVYYYQTIGNVVVFQKNTAAFPGQIGALKYAGMTNDYGSQLSMLFGGNTGSGTTTRRNDFYTISYNVRTPFAEEAESNLYPFRNVVCLTQAEYDDIAVKDPRVIYLITQARRGTTSTGPSIEFISAESYYRAASLGGERAMTLYNNFLLVLVGNSVYNINLNDGAISTPQSLSTLNSLNINSFTIFTIQEENLLFAGQFGFRTMYAYSINPTTGLLTYQASRNLSLSVPNTSTTGSWFNRWTSRLFVGDFNDDIIYVYDYDPSNRASPLTESVPERITLPSTVAAYGMTGTRDWLFVAQHSTTANQANQSLIALPSAGPTYQYLPDPNFTVLLPSPSPATAGVAAMGEDVLYVMNPHTNKIFVFKISGSLS